MAAYNILRTMSGEESNIHIILSNNEEIINGANGRRKSERG